MPSYLESLLEKRAELRSTSKRLYDQALAEERDMSDADNTTVADIEGQIDGLDQRIAPLQQAELRDQQHQARQAEVDRATARQVRDDKDRPAAPELRDEPRGDDAVLAVYRTAGGYLSDWARWKKDDDTQSKQRLMRAIQHQTTGDNAGLLPQPLIGDVSSILNSARPLINAVANPAMPAKGKTFLRPKVTQHTDVGPQVTEKTALTSQKMTVISTSVSKSTYGGVVNISQQDIDWSEPSIWDMVLTDLFGVLAQKTEAAFASIFTTQITAKTTLAAAAASDVVLAALYTGASTVYTAVGEMPDTLFVSVDMWAKLGSQVDANKRPLFPYLNPQNANGQMGIDSLAGNPLGVKLVVSPGLAASTMILGVSRFAEWYQTGPGSVSVSEPELLGVQLAVYTYAAGLVVQPSAFTYFAA